MIARGETSIHVPANDLHLKFLVAVVDGHKCILSFCACPGEIVGGGIDGGAEVTCCTFAAARLSSFDKCPQCQRLNTVGHDKLLAYSKASFTYQIAYSLKHFF